MIKVMQDVTRKNYASQLVSFSKRKYTTKEVLTYIRILDILIMLLFD